MPINNSINKQSDTFLATQNITANSNSLRLTTTTNLGTFTNAITSLATTTGLMNLNLEYINNSITTGPRIAFATARGTPASPTAVTGSMAKIGLISFNAYDGSVYQQRCSIESFWNLNYEPIISLNAGVTTLNMRFGLGSFARQLDTNAQYVFSVPAYTNLSVNGFPTDSSGYVQVRTNSGNSNQTFIGFSHFNFSNTTNQGASLVLLRSRNSTPSLTTKVEANDEIGQVVFAGADGTTTAKQMGWIKCFADGATGSSDVPGRITIATTPDGTATPSEAMNLDNAGRITQVRQPSFSASLSADQANATGDGTAFTVPFNVEQYDQGSNFAANTFTAPIAGKYRFNYILSIDDLLVGHTKLVLTVGGRVVERCNPYALADSDGFCLLAGSVDLSLAASATVTMVCEVSGSTKTVTVKGTTTSGTFLSGQLQV